MRTAHGHLTCEPLDRLLGERELVEDLGVVVVARRVRFERRGELALARFAGAPKTSVRPSATTGLSYAGSSSRWDLLRRHHGRFA